MTDSELGRPAGFEATGAKRSGGLGKVLVSAGVCMLVLAAGAGAILVAMAIRSKSEQAEARVVDRKVPNVNVKVLEPVTLDDTVVLTGTLLPWEEVLVSAESTGKVEMKGVDEGDTVKAGQVMFRVDTETIQVQLEQAKAELRLANQDFERVSKLVEKGASTAQTLDTITARRDVAAASARLLEVQLKKSVVRAPIDAVVDTCFVEQDEFTDTGSPMVRLVQVHKVKAQVGIPERDIAHFGLGETVRVTVDAMPDKTFEGVIHRLATTADMTTHTFCAEIAVDNEDGVLKPGMILRAMLVRDTYPNSILIPIFASMLLDDKRFVFVEEDGTAALRQIETGVLQGSEVQVTSGLKPGERLIVTGQYDVREGEPVKVREVL